MQFPQTGLKLAVLALALIVLGLPVNTIAAFALLCLAAIAVLTGVVRTGLRAWGFAAAIVAVALGAQNALAPPRLDEGFNVFLPSPALQRGLPADVYGALLAAFDAQYPPDKRCDPKAVGCWRGSTPPDRAFAFAADGIFHKSDMSRAVMSVDFDNPVWHRLGFINETRLNWYPVSDVQRARRDGRFWMSYDRWQLSMPWFEMIRLPQSYVGGQLCWRGDILWEGAGERFTTWNGSGCRPITADDAGRRIVGMGIKPQTLAMQLQGPPDVQFKQWARPLIMLIAVIAVILVLVRIQPRRMRVPAALVGLAALAIAIDDMSFLGGVRPFDGGDDGLFYDSVARDILQKLLAGDWRGFLEGGESVFYYGGPGLRYFRALEHIVFGDSYLGYLALVLSLPFIVLALFKRFLPPPWPLALALLFAPIPFGIIFGTSFIDYAKWAARGFADPAAYIFFLAGLVPLVAARDGLRNAFWPAFFGALLIVIGVAMKPIVVVAAFVILAGVWLRAAWRQQWLRVAGLSLGALPVFSMALHNWVFGGQLVLFSANAGDSNLLIMPPSAWLGALRELVTFNFSGGLIHRAQVQIPNWLSGPAETWLTAPINAAGVAILIYVVAHWRRFDRWLGLIAAAALAQHAVALFYATTSRYHFLTWFLTLLVAASFMQKIGVPWLDRRYPALMGGVPLRRFIKR